MRKLPPLVASLHVAAAGKESTVVNARRQSCRHCLFLFPPAPYLRKVVVISSKLNRLCMSGCQPAWRSFTNGAGQFSLTTGRVPPITCQTSILVSFEQAQVNRCCACLCANAKYICSDMN